MKKYKETKCTFCGMKVRAELIRSDDSKDVFLCPNTNPKGEQHVFTKLTGTIRLLKKAKSILAFFNLFGN